MYKASIIGASGYVGAELAKLILQHSHFELHTLFVSESSADANKAMSELHGELAGIVDLPLKPINESALHAVANEVDLIFLATPHEASHRWVPLIANQKAIILDLSGAYRFQNPAVYPQYYGFEHSHPEILAETIYGLADWHTDKIIRSNVISVPGCYPTASLTALKPLGESELLEPSIPPIINATSGVSGAGRKANLVTSVCEVSLQAYNIGIHRHQPEISEYLGQSVIFTPHLGNFKRGILATCTAKLKSGVTLAEVDAAFASAYQDNPMVRLKAQSPKLQDVINTGFCDLYWHVDVATGYVIVVSAIDNLMKGAASQALQCANLRFGLPKNRGLLRGDA